jgi:hypothetical protein
LIIYSITYAIDASIEKEWIEYMKSTHIPLLINTGFFSSFQHTRIVPEQGLDLAFNIQFSCRDLSTLNKYIDDKKENCESQLNQKFQGKFASFFTKLEQVD